MADRNQLKKAVDSPISADDPFAELTRIMGFDPRVPVAPKQPAAVEKLAALAAEEDDFSIDLEKELMGDFDSLDDDVQAPVHAAAEPEVAHRAAPETAEAEEDTMTEDFDFVFDADLAAREHDPEVVAAADRALADELHAAFADEPAQVESEAAEMHAGEIPANEEPATAGGTLADEALTDEFETALADEMAVEAPAAPLEAAEDDTPVGDEAPVGELETASAEQAPSEELDAASAETDAEVSAELDETFAAHFDDHLAAAEEPAAVELEAAEEPVALDPEPVEELAAAEPELVAEPEVAAEIEMAGEEPSEPVAEAYDDDADDVPLIPLGAARDFASADDAHASVDAEFGSADEQAQSTGEPFARVDEAEDYDLEAELSVLLGKSPASTAAAPAVAAPAAETSQHDETAHADVEGDDAAPMVAESADEPVASADDDWAVDIDDPLPLVAETAEVETAGVEPVSEPVVSTPLHELRAEEPTTVSEDVHAEAVGQDHDEAALDVPAYAPAAEAPHQEEAPFEDENDPLSEFVVEQELQAELAALDEDIDFTLDDLDLTDEPVASAAVGRDEHPMDEPVYADEPAVEAIAEDEIVPAEMINDPIDEQPVAKAAPEPARKAPEPVPAEEEEDPFAMLAAMVRSTPAAASPARFTAPASMSYQELPRSSAPAASESPAVSTTEYQYQNHSYTGRGPANVPDIETVDVPESAVALADDLDIPDISFEDDLPLAADFDDFEAELASAFHQQPAAQAQPAAEPVRDVPRDAYRHEYAQYQQPAPAAPNYTGAAVATAAAAATAYVSAQPAARSGYADDRYGDVDSSGHLAGDHAPDAYRAMDDDDLAYDPELNEDMAGSVYQGAAERQPSGNRRGLMIAAIVGGVVLIGGIGAYALSGGNGSGAPALVRADTDPVKVRPENPGGTSVPNQDNKVFQTMNGTGTVNAPTQEKLISGTEEPVDMAARAEPRVVTPQPSAAEEGEEAMEDAPLTGDDEISAIAQDPVAAEIAAAPKAEDRVAPTAAEEPAGNGETLAVAPRRVRTMVVRADGTLVPSEEPAAAPAQPQGEETTASALEPADPTKSLADPIAPESTGSLKPSDAAPAPVAEAKPAAPKATQSSMPDSGPVAPSRPGDQPVDVVGEVKPQQVAAASGAAAAGAWSMQIASQPSEAAAQSSYQDLARRYGSVIGDKGVNIVKAEIAGKGTFWRVRVPAGSRNDAISLCESYKAAGGNCFVSK